MWSRLSDETTLPSLIFFNIAQRKSTMEGWQNEEKHKKQGEGQGNEAQRAAESETGNQRENARRKRSCESAQSSRPSAPGYQLQGHRKVLKVK